MDTQDFAYWLKGYVEVCGDRPSVVQWKVIVDHLNLVFNKVTPDRMIGEKQPLTPPFNPFTQPYISPVPPWYLPPTITC